MPGAGSPSLCRICSGRARALHELYRKSSDDAYLTEEAGRRASAARLLDLIGRHVPSGRLLDVGCGPGLLLDEARRRGYGTVGLELTQTRAAVRERRAPRGETPRYRTALDPSIVLLAAVAAPAGQSRPGSR